MENKITITKGEVLIILIVMLLLLINIFVSENEAYNKCINSGNNTNICEELR